MKKAFSLVELFIIVFIITAVIFAIIPLSISNVKQAHYIADWKNYIEQVNYSYETLLEYKRVKTMDNKQYIAKLLEYLDAKKINTLDENLTGYTFKQLDYSFFQYDKLDKFDDIYIDVKHRIIGVKYGDSCDENIACATLWVDLNGMKKPNVVGKDIFLYEVYPTSIEPYKKGTDFELLKQDCARGGTGLSCSKYFLLGGNMK